MTITAIASSDSSAVFWRKPKKVKAIIIVAIVFLILVCSSLLVLVVYKSTRRSRRASLSNRSILSVPHHDASSRRAHEEALKKKVEEDLNKKYNSVDGLIEAFTKYENSKEVNVNSLEGSKRTTMQAIGGMSSGTLKKLKTITEGEKVTMSQSDCESLKNFINGAQIDEPLRQTLIENLENNVAIISETSPIDISPLEAIEELKTVEFGRDFLDAINTVGYKVDINAHLGMLDTFSNVPLDDISKLYAKDTDITNAKKLHLIAKELVNVIKHCKDRGPKTLAHNDPMLDKLNKLEVKAYLKDDDYRKFLATFKTASDGPTGPTGSVVLENSKPKPPKNNIKPIVADFLAAIQAITADNTKLDNVDKCRQAADKLITVENVEDISDMLGLSVSVEELKIVELLLVGMYDTGSKFIQDFFEHTLAETAIKSKSSTESIYKTYNLFNSSIGPFDWDKLDVNKYKEEKDAHLILIRDTLLKFDPNLITVGLLDSHVPDLSKLRNNLFYSFDPVEPAFEKIEFPDDMKSKRNRWLERMKAKILTHFHPQVMDILISKRDNCAAELYDVTKAVNKSTFQFMLKYLDLSPKFNESLLLNIKSISYENSLESFFGDHLPRADVEFETCILIAAKDKLRTVIINDPSIITVVGVAAINECITRRLQYGSISRPGFQKEAIKLDEKLALAKYAAKPLVKNEIKVISEKLAVQLENTEEDKALLLLLKTEYEVLKNIEIFAGTIEFPTFFNFLQSCYHCTWKIIGNEIVTTKTSQTELTTSITKLENFKKLPYFESITSRLLLQVELVLDILPDFKSSSQDDKVNANVRLAKTLSEALKETGIIVDKVKEFWKYRFAIWYLVNRPYNGIEKILKAAKEVIEPSNTSGFESQVLAMRDTSATPKWIFNKEKGTIFPNGKPITNVPLFDFLNALVLDHHDHRVAYYSRDPQDFIKEMIEKGTIDVVKDAILLTDCQWELNSLANKGSITKATWDQYIKSDMSKSTKQFRSLADDCFRNGHVKELKRFLIKQMLHALGPNVEETEYQRRIIELTQMELERKLKSKLDEIDNSLKDVAEFKKLFSAFLLPSEQYSPPDIIGAISLAKYKNSNPATIDRKKEFWNLYKQFMNVAIKFEASNIQSVGTLAHHQDALIELKRLELYNAIQPLKGGSKNLILGENYDKVKDQIILSSTTPVEEARYLKFLKLLTDLKDRSFLVNSSAAATVKIAGNLFFDSFSIHHFDSIIESDVTDVEIIGLKAWMTKRKELFGSEGSSSFIHDPIQSSVNEALDLCVEYGKAKVDTINAVLSEPKAKAYALLKNNSLEEFIKLWEDKNTKPWMDNFVDKLFATGKLHQKYLNALHQLIVNIDSIKPIVDVNLAALKPASSSFFALTRREYVWHKTSMLKESIALVPLVINASNKDRIKHCYLNGVPRFARFILRTKKGDLELNYMMEKAKTMLNKRVGKGNDDPLPHESQRHHADQFMQYYRLYELFNSLEEPTLIKQIDGGAADGKKVLSFEVEIPSTSNAITAIAIKGVKDEIMKMPIFIENPSFKHILASKIDSSISMDENKKAIMEAIGEKANSIRNDCPELLEEEVTRLIRDHWKETAISIEL